MLYSNFLPIKVLKNCLKLVSKTIFLKSFKTVNAHIYAHKLRLPKISPLKTCLN